MKKIYVLLILLLMSLTLGCLGYGYIEDSPVKTVDSVWVNGDDIVYFQNTSEAYYVEAKKIKVYKDIKDNMNSSITIFYSYNPITNKKYIESIEIERNNS